MRHRAEFLHVGAIVVEAAWLAYIDVGLAPENLVAECVLQARHHGQRDDGRHHADGDADGRDERDDGDERLFPLREQVSQRDMQLERQISHVSSTEETE